MQHATSARRCARCGGHTTCMPSCLMCVRARRPRRVCFFSVKLLARLASQQASSSLYFLPLFLFCSLLSRPPPPPPHTHTHVLSHTCALACIRNMCTCLAHRGAGGKPPCTNPRVRLCRKAFEHALDSLNASSRGAKDASRAPSACASALARGAGGLLAGGHRGWGQ
jgi:hypothetical protein